MDSGPQPDNRGVFIVRVLRLVQGEEVRRVRRILERILIARGNDDIDNMRSCRKSWKRYDPVESGFAGPWILERSDDVEARPSVKIGDIDALRMVDNRDERGRRATAHGQRPAAYVKRPGLRNFNEIDGARRLGTNEVERSDVDASGCRCQILRVARIRTVRRDRCGRGANVAWLGRILCREVADLKDEFARIIECDDRRRIAMQIDFRDPTWDVNVSREGRSARINRYRLRAGRARHRHIG